MQPLEAAARKAGVEVLLEHRMTAIYREQPRSGRVLGIAVDNKGNTLNIRARKAVIVATGGSTGNVNFRRMFDPRLTEEYCGLAGMPWSEPGRQRRACRDGDQRLAVGAVQLHRRDRHRHHQAGQIGCQYGYVNLRWQPGSQVFDRRARPACT